MKGSKKIIATLNALLADELAARDQYFIHSRMLSEWGLVRAAERIAHEMEDETQHASELIRRILFLEGLPAMTPSKLTIGADLPDIFAKDLAVEYTVVKNLRAAIALCETEQDYVTREILEKMLDDTEEDHAHWLEQQLGLIKLVGLQNYLQTQMTS
ncbi:bacterioferritin [Pseudothauera nasutitermitis]|uniref:Bacterioferritin n=1 Tax=Pseudothauera nasutitermitis TaxID=2565930 RepID=A0A4S4AXC9_9RHOO|nr:bacterioferritin [Pseudothauera nasutitermitis]THF64743.1 bacterioferritin [Pseudothauera nasutitermitis]